MIRILLQSTIPAVDDDWNIRRYSLLRSYLASLEDERGEPLFAVTARDREPDARGEDRCSADWQTPTSMRSGSSPRTLETD
jgi:hypothetical protein